MKGNKDLPLHRSSIDLYLSPLLFEDDLELRRPFENGEVLEARNTSFDSHLGIHLTSSSSSHRRWDTILTTFFFIDLSMVEGRLGEIMLDASSDDSQMNKEGVEASTAMLEEEPSLLLLKTQRFINVGNQNHQFTQINSLK